MYRVRVRMCVCAYVRMYVCACVDMCLVPVPPLHILLSPAWVARWCFPPFRCPQAGEPGSPLRIGFVADMGYANHSDDPVRVLGELARNGSIDLMIHNGDVSYADGPGNHKF